MLAGSCWATGTAPPPPREGLSTTCLSEGLVLGPQNVLSPLHLLTQLSGSGMSLMCPSKPSWPLSRATHGLGSLR